MIACLKHPQKGISLIETLVGLTIFFILSVIAYPGFDSIRNQLRVTEDVNAIGLIISELRAEAVRLRSPAVITFTNTGFTWDLENDGNQDGSYTFNTGTAWDNLPDTMAINGFGLIRGLPGNSTTLTISNGSSTHAIAINGNGHVEVAS